MSDTSPDREIATPTTSRPRVSVVLPCFNGAHLIARSLSRLCGYLADQAALFGPSEVLVVDDGSTDATAQVVSTGFPGVRLLRHQRNRGKGAAVKTGMLAARGDYRFFMDADIPFDLDEIPRMLHCLDRRGFHVCIASRPLSGTSSDHRPSIVGRVMSALFREFVARVVVTGVRDTQCGLKGFRGHVADYLFSQSRVSNFAFDVEILYLAFKNDLDVKRVPVRVGSYEHSTVSIWRHGIPMLLRVLQLPITYYSGGYRLQSAERWRALDELADAGQHVDSAEQGREPRADRSRALPHFGPVPER